MSLILDETKLAIAKAIYSLRHELGKKKLSVVAVAARAGISRQAINKTHEEFLSVIKGEDEIPKAYLDIFIDKQSTGTVSVEKLNALKEQHKQEILSVKADTFTSLMKSDLSLHKAKLLKNEQVNLKKQLLDRLSDNRKLELALGDEKNKVLELQQRVNELELDGSGAVSRMVFSPDMRLALEDYESSQDNKAFIMAQDFAYRQVIKNALDHIKQHSVNAVYLFIHRHNADINDFLPKIPLNSGKHVFLSIPIISRDKRKKYLKELIELDIPVNAIVPITNEARKNWFRNLNKVAYPDIIVKQFDDNFQEPILDEGFETIQFIKSN